MSPKIFAKVTQVVFSRVRSSSHLPIPSPMLLLQFLWSDLYTPTNKQTDSQNKTNCASWKMKTINCVQQQDIYFIFIYMSYHLQSDFFIFDFSLHMIRLCAKDRNCFLLSEEIFKLRFLLSVIIWNSGKDLLLFFNREAQQSRCKSALLLIYQWSCTIGSDLSKILMWQRPLKKIKLENYLNTSVNPRFGMQCTFGEG